MECVCCLGYTKSTILSFDEDQWERLRVVAKKWIFYQRPPLMFKTACRNQHLWDLAFTDISESYGYHNKCRSNFMNTSKLHAAQIAAVRQADEQVAESETSDYKPSPVKTRRIFTDFRRAEKSNVLAEKCIICEKKLLFYKKYDKTVRETLRECQTLQAGQLKCDIDRNSDCCMLNIMMGSCLF